MWRGGERDKLSVKRSAASIKPKRAPAAKHSAFFSSSADDASSPPPPPPPRKRLNMSQLAAVSDWALAAGLIADEPKAVKRHQPSAPPPIAAPSQFRLRTFDTAAVAPPPPPPMPDLDMEPASAHPAPFAALPWTTTQQSPVLAEGPLKQPPAKAASLKLIGTRHVFATVLDVALPSSRAAPASDATDNSATGTTRPQHSPQQGSFFAPRGDAGGGNDDAVSFWNEGQRMQVD